MHLCLCYCLSVLFQNICSQNPTPTLWEAWALTTAVSACSGWLSQMSLTLKSPQCTGHLIKEGCRSPQCSVIWAFTAEIPDTVKSHRAETNHPHCALSKFLSPRILKHYKIAVISHYWLWTSLLYSHRSREHSGSECTDLSRCVLEIQPLYPYSRHPEGEHREAGYTHCIWRGKNAYISLVKLSSYGIT